MVLTLCLNILGIVLHELQTEVWENIPDFNLRIAVYFGTGGKESITDFNLRIKLIVSLIVFNEGKTKKFKLSNFKTL